MAVAPAANHPRAVLLVLKGAARALKAAWDAAWTIPAAVIAGRQVTYTVAVGNIPVNTAMTVTWGDGTSSTYNITGASVGAVHTYTAAGTYTVRMTIGPSTKSTSVTVV